MNEAGLISCGMLRVSEGPVYESLSVKSEQITKKISKVYSTFLSRSGENLASMYGESAEMRADRAEQKIEAVRHRF